MKKALIILTLFTGLCLSAFAQDAPAGGLADFTDLAGAKAFAAKGPTVLFFSADWCLFCQADLRQFKAEGKRLGDVTVVVVDYDAAKDLKTAYKVTYQHTYVWIDSRGAAKAVWNGGGIDGILSRVKAM